MLDCGHRVQLTVLWHRLLDLKSFGYHLLTQAHVKFSHNLPPAQLFPPYPPFAHRDSHSNELARQRFPTEAYQAAQSLWPQQWTGGQQNLSLSTGRCSHLHALQKVAELKSSRPLKQHIPKIKVSILQKGKLKGSLEIVYPLSVQTQWYLLWLSRMKWEESHPLSSTAKIFKVAHKNNS